MPESVVLITLSHGGAVLTTMSMKEVDETMLEYSNHAANGIIHFPLLSGKTASVMPHHVADWIEVDPPKGGNGITVEERDSGAKLTVRSGVQQIGVDFKDDEALISDFLIQFTEEVLEKSLIARRSM